MRGRGQDIIRAGESKIHGFNVSKNNEIKLTKIEDETFPLF